MKRRILYGTVLLALLAFPIAPAMAGKGGANGGSSVNLVELSASTTASGSGPYYGESVTFAVATNRTDSPWVHLDCSQSGSLVYSESHPMYNSNSTNDPGTFRLGPSNAWTGGAADCTATLVGYTTNWKEQELASMSFRVSG